MCRYEKCIQANEFEYNERHCLNSFVEIELYRQMISMDVFILSKQVKSVVVEAYVW